MKRILFILIILTASFSFAQEKEELLALKKANNYVYQGNTLIDEDDFVSAEMEYRKAISEQETTIAGIYNLGNSYYKKGNFEEALYRHEQAAKVATSKAEKHKAFHNIGNILMQNKKCEEAVEAYKNALRNNPSDDETRYNLGLAKVCAEQQKQDQQDNNDDNKDDQNEDNKDENKDNQDQKDNQGQNEEDKKDKEGDNDEDKKDEGDQDKKDGEDEKDEDGKPKDEKEDEGKGGEDEKDKKEQPQQPQQGKMSPQQIKNLLEAMNNQEQKVQEKMNAEKQKGIKIKTDKDW